LAKVTNITGLSSVTRNGRVFASPDLPTQPANVKGKTKMVKKQNDKTTLTPNEDVPVKGLPEKRDGCGKKEVSLEEASFSALFSRASSRSLNNSTKPRPGSLFWNYS